MGTLKAQILADRTIAMKNRESEKVSSLNTLIGELDRVSKEPTDEQVIKAVKKMVEGNLEVGSQEGFTENLVISKYLPQMLTEDEIRAALTNFVGLSENGVTSKDVGLFMKYMKTNFEGRYDGKLASDIFRGTYQ